MARGRPATAPGTYGDISARQLTNGRWQANLRIRLLNGELKQVRANGKTEAEAKRRVKTKAVETTGVQDTDELTTTSPITALVDHWLEQHDGAAGTIDVYKSTIRNHITPGIGQLRINEATTSRLDAFIRSLEGPGTARRARAILSGAFSLAARYGLTQHNPMRETSSVKVKKAEPRALTTMELRTFRRMVRYYTTAPLAGSRTRATAFPRIMDFVAGTGVRISEALRVEVAHIDLTATPPTALVNVTKDGGSQRVIQLPKIAVAAVKAQLADLQGLEGLNVYLFPTSTGKPISKSNVERWMRNAKLAWEKRPKDHRQADDVDVSWVTPHSFRDTVATVLADQVSLLAASQQLGHSDSTITEHHYLQRPTAGPAVADVLDQAFHTK